MEVPLAQHLVKKGTTVKLIKDLPGGHFGNSMPLRAISSHGMPRSGVVVSEGFVQGNLEVVFDLYPEGRQQLRFNLLSAPNYLTVDIY